MQTMQHRSLHKGGARPAPVQLASRQLRHVVAHNAKAPSIPSFMSLTSVEGFIEVQSVAGIRVLTDQGAPRVEYLVEWKDGSTSTWEPAGNLSEDLVRNYEEAWWGAARKGEFATLASMLEGGQAVLANIVDENRRSALHFAAALGKADAVRLLLEAGADPNLQDKEGYTPLHMAAGYMHTGTMKALLEGGANPQIRDNSGKDVVSLVEGIRNNMPLSLGTITTRLRLEEVFNALTDMLYEEALISGILEERRAADGSREFLVSFQDGREDAWVHERDVAADILADYQEGIEYKRAAAIIDMVQVGTERRFKIKWEDDYPDSWEPEEHVPPSLIELFRANNPALFDARVAAAATSTSTDIQGAIELQDAAASAHGNGSQPHQQLQGVGVSGNGNSGYRTQAALSAAGIRQSLAAAAAPVAVNVISAGSSSSQRSSHSNGEGQHENGNNGHTGASASVQEPEPAAAGAGR